MSIRYLTIFTLLFSLNLRAQTDTTIVEAPVPVSVISLVEPETLVRPMNMIISDGGRGWTADQQSAERINESFAEWLRCYHTNAENCEPCAPPENTLVITDVLATRCLPPGSDRTIVFSNLLTPAQRRTRDERICGCYNDGNASLFESLNFNDGIQRRINLAQTRYGDEAQKELTSSLASERYEIAFSAASYVTDSTAALALGRRFTVSPGANPSPGAAGNRATPASGGSAGITNAVLASTMNQAGVNEADARSTAETFELTENLLDGPRGKAGVCLPYRQFLASKQFPINPAFYDSLPRNPNSAGTYNPNDWNYRSLLEDFRRIVGSRDLESVINNKDDRNAQRIFARLQFLHNNPIIKNILMDSNPESSDQRARLYRGILRMPRPDCGPETCVRGPDFAAQAIAYRTVMAQYLNIDQVQEAARRGSESSRDLSTAVRLANANRQAMLSETVIGENSASDSSAWNSFCRDRNEPPQVMYLRSMNDALGQRNILDPTSDSQFIEENNQVCGTRRMSRESVPRPIVFDDYLQTICPNGNTAGRCAPAFRSDLVAEFVRNTTPIEGDEESAAADVVANNYLPVLSGGAGAPVIRNEDIVSYNSQSSNGGGGGISGTRFSQTSISSNSQAAAAPTRPAEVQSSQNLLNASTLGLPPSEQTVIVPRAPEVTSEVQRESLAAGEDESRQIREEISSLRDVIRRDPASGGPRDSQALTTLNERLASLERRLQTRESENSALRDQIADAQASRDSQAQRAQAQSTSGSNDGRRSNQVAGSATLQGGTSSGSEAANLSSGGGSSQQNSVSGRTAPVGSRPVISSGNAALLSKYGVQSGSVQGSLVVANPSSEINYQDLQTQSEGSIVSLPVQLDEYNQIASNNQEALRPYLGRCSALDKDVCRFMVSAPGAGNPIEIYVLRNGNDFSIIPSNSQGRRPASVLPAEARAFTLDNLRNELGR